ARGFEILEYLAAQAVQGVLPNMAALESALGLSVVIFFDHYQDRSVLSRLQSIWRVVIAKLLRIQEEGNRGGGVVRTFIREQLISLVSRVAFRQLEIILRWEHRRKRPSPEQAGGFPEQECQAG